MLEFSSVGLSGSSWIGMFLSRFKNNLTSGLEKQNRIVTTYRYLLIYPNQWQGCAGTLQVPWLVSGVCRYLNQCGGYVGINLPKLWLRASKDVSLGDSLLAPANPQRRWVSQPKTDEFSPESEIEPQSPNPRPITLSTADHLKYCMPNQILYAQSNLAFWSYLDLTCV